MKNVRRERGEIFPFFHHYIFITTLLVYLLSPCFLHKLNYIMFTELF